LIASPTDVTFLTADDGPFGWFDLPPKRLALTEALWIGYWLHDAG
jgi:hypothetical protein